MRPIEEIAWDLCSLYYDGKPPINSNGEVEYFLVGSLATLPLLCAEQIEDVMVDETGKIMAVDNHRMIDDSTRKAFQQYRRKIHDVDYVSVKSDPDKGKVLSGINNISDINDLSDLGSRVINITDPRDPLPGYSLCKITKKNSQIIVPCPIDMLVGKISQCVRRVQAVSKWQLKEQTERKEEVINKHKEDYFKQIKDLIPLINGVCGLYSIEQISTRIKEALDSFGELDYNILEVIKYDLQESPFAIEVFDTIKGMQL